MLTRKYFYRQMKIYSIFKAIWALGLYFSMRVFFKKTGLVWTPSQEEGELPCFYNCQDAKSEM